MVTASLFERIGSSRWDSYLISTLIEARLLAQGKASDGRFYGWVAGASWPEDRENGDCWVKAWVELRWRLGIMDDPNERGWRDPCVKGVIATVFADAVS